MTQASSSVLTRSGGNKTIATHTANSKDHQVIMGADHNGHILGSKDVYFFHSETMSLVAAASTTLLDLFNADASKVIRVLSIEALVDIEAAVTGVGIEFKLLRTTAVGTGGTAKTAWLPDLTQTALDADVTCRVKPAGGATLSTELMQFWMSTEETLSAVHLTRELIPEVLRPPVSWNGIVLRNGNGLAITQNTNSSAGSVAFRIGFTQE